MKITKQYLKQVIKEELQKEIFGFGKKKQEEPLVTQYAEPQASPYAVSKFPSTEKVQAAIQKAYGNKAEIKVISVDPKGHSAKEVPDVHGERGAQETLHKVVFTINGKQKEMDVPIIQGTLGYDLGYIKPINLGFNIIQPKTSAVTQGAKDKVAKDQEEYDRIRYSHLY